MTGFFFFFWFEVDLDTVYILIVNVTVHTKIVPPSPIIFESTLAFNLEVLLKQSSHIYISSVCPFIYSLEIEQFQSLPARHRVECCEDISVSP